MQRNRLPLVLPLALVFLLSACGLGAPAAPEPSPTPLPLLPTPAPKPQSAPAPTAPPAPAFAYCPAGATPAFVLGFADLKQLLGDEMGDPIECEHPDANSGDTVQLTSRGIAYYRQSTNTPTFFNGFDRWALTAGEIVHWTGDSLDPPV